MLFRSGQGVQRTDDQRNNDDHILPQGVSIHGDTHITAHADDCQWVVVWPASAGTLKNEKAAPMGRFKTGLTVIGRQTVPNKLYFTEPLGSTCATDTRCICTSTPGAISTEITVSPNLVTLPSKPLAVETSSPLANASIMALCSF